MEDEIVSAYDDCSFEGVSDDALEVSRTLLLNLGERFLRGLKNQVTNAEHKSVLLAVKAMDRELELRKRENSIHEHSNEEPVESGANGER